MKALGYILLIKLFIILGYITLGMVLTASI